ncbi:MAG: cadherin domain-containing protein [Pirellulaceae bacterium]
MLKSRLQRNAIRRRLLGFENLEHRRVLAAYISEFHFDPLFGDSSEDQYLELRGGVGTTLEEGTYFVGIESADGIDTLGDVHTVIDLSNLVFGSNGYMVFVQQGSSWVTDSAATVYAGTGSGFNSLTSGVFESDSLDGSIHAGSSTYLLIQSETKPELGDDIDSDNDGTPDGPYSEWEVLDGFATLPWIESTQEQRTYASIAFVEDGVGDGHLPGATVISTTDQAYAGRFGASIGYRDGDWISGNTVEESSGSFDFQFQHGIFGTPTQPSFGGEFLDNIGGPNWFSSASGFVFEDLNEDGIRQANEPGISGMQVTTRFEDTQNSATSFEESIDPNDFEAGTDASNSPEHYTLITAGTDNVPLGFKVTAEERELGTIFDKVFAHEGVKFFSSIRRLRMDFFRDARSVSINVTGNSNLSVTYGRLEVFDKDNNSLGFVRSSGLLDGVSEVLSVSSNDDIAWAVAYSDNEFQASSPFGEYDRIVAEMPRATATSIAAGAYASTPLIADTYEVEVAAPGRLYQTTPANEEGYTVGLADRQDVRELDFGFREKGAPAITDQSLNVGEHVAAEAVFAQLAIALDYPSQQLDITITGGDPDNQFSINEETFELSSANGDLNFETTDSYVLDILIEDRDFPDLSDAGQVTITILDENDTPQVASNNGNLDENSALGTVVATMQATDEDAPGDASTLTFSIEDGNTGDAFEINPVTGEVRVASPEQVNFETNPTFDLLIRATDMGSPVEFGEAILSVTLNDLDEIPVVLDTGLTIAENSPAFTSVGHLELKEYDAGETITWRIAGVDSMSFDLLPDGELVVKDGVQLDFETKPTYEFFVDATDDGNPPKTGERTITITVLDANDAPVIETETLEVDENSAADVVVGTVVATDQDEGHVVSYAIVGGVDGDKFAIDATTGELTVAEGADLNFEANAVLEVLVSATDDQTPPASSEKLVAVNLIDVNDPPLLDVEQSSVVENSSAGMVVAIEVNDPDVNESHTFEILNQDVDWFSIDSAGQLVVAEGADINFESSAANSSVVELRVTDSAGEQATGTITISATDANDPPEVASPLEDQAAEPNQLFEFVIPDGTFVDEDEGDSLRFSATTEAGFSLPSWLLFDSATRKFQGTPTDSDSGNLAVKVNVLDNANALVSDEFNLEVASAFPWHNSGMAEDVNDDNFVTPIDALMVINYLNNASSSEVPPGSAAEFGLVDVNGDNFVTAIDALIVVNQLNSGGGGEGESAQGSYYYAPPRGGDFGFDANEEEEDLLQLLASEAGALSR